MRKVRAKKDFPFVKSGEEFDLGDDSNYMKRYNSPCGYYHKSEILLMIQDGWLEYVEEEKSFNEKIQDVKDCFKEVESLEHNFSDYIKSRTKDSPMSPNELYNIACKFFSNEKYCDPIEKSLEEKFRDNLYNTQKYYYEISKDLCAIAKSHEKKRYLKELDRLVNMHGNYIENGMIRKKLEEL